ncbi:MAG: hypothetical protein E7164_03315 [Firmicutes bacterium]|nr:hypothetical protein [Bacillota bacterium]
MNKITFNEKLSAVLSYFLGIHFFIYLKKDKSTFLKRHLRKGKVINVVVAIWLIIMIFVLRMMDVFSVSKILKIILYVFNGLLCVLILMYQVYWLIKIINKK